MALIKHTCFALLILLSGTAFGEITLIESKQQKGDIETGSYRAVYLGRLFSSVDPSPTQSITGGTVSDVGQITGMYGLVHIRGATNVALYGGDGAVGFNTLINNGKMVDTGLRFSNTNNNVQSFILPGVPAFTSPFSLSASAGTALGDLLRTRGSMDFWLATTDVTSTFTAPSNVGSDSKNFYVQFRATAVPEPASWLLGSTAAAMGWLRFRRKTKA